VEDVGLHVAHDSVRPHGSVGVEVGGEAFATAEVQEGVAVGKRMKVVFAGEYVEETPADGDVFVECGAWDGRGVGLDGEGDALVGDPVGDGLGEVEAALETGVADAADAFVGECGFDGAGEADGVGPGAAKLGGSDGGDALDVLPDLGERCVDDDGGVYGLTSTIARRSGSADRQNIMFRAALLCR
jgi:hypothetical protein